MCSGIEVSCQLNGFVPGSGSLATFSCVIGSGLAKVYFPFSSVFESCQKVFDNMTMDICEATVNGARANPGFS